MTIQEIVEEIKTKTAVELCELVKALEEEFGVSAGASPATAGPATTAAAALTPNSSSNALTKSLSSTTVIDLTASIISCFVMW